MRPAPGPHVAAALAPALLAGAAAGQHLAVQTITTSASQCTHVAQPPGEYRRLYFIEQLGNVKVVRDGALLATPVLSQLPNLVAIGESGLLGLTFHPQFQSNGYMYLLYSHDAQPFGSRVVRYTLNPQSPDTADPQSAHVILTVPRPGANAAHHGGWIGFGPDGYLYISSGDSAGHPQQLDNWGGKILRVDVDADDFPQDPLRNYAVPPSNPFASAPPPTRPEIWALGLRNPWRCSFDRVTGDFWIGDVGQTAQEEINFQPAATTPPFTALNYGWPLLEGTFNHTQDPLISLDPAYTAPIFEYTRDMGRSVVGGYVYRGAAIPYYRGLYFFSDVYGQLNGSYKHWAFRKTAEGITEFRPRHGGQAFYFSLGEDNFGELYYCGSGLIKLVPNCPPNCDGSTVSPKLNVADFTCFLRAFAADDPYANCDRSTQAPTLTVSDFTCFLDRFAQGCP
jgi:glucose/arabinose dehydrogenase